MSNNETQTQILNTGVENPINKKSKNAKRKKSQVVKSRRRTSLDEFAAVNNIRPEVKAGFKAWLKGQYFHFDNEWDDLFKTYSNR